MKNNKLLYLLTIFITLFTFNINANAAQELTCIYKMAGKVAGLEVERDIALVQFTTGKQEVYYHVESSSDKIDDISDISSSAWAHAYNNHIVHSGKNVDDRFMQNYIFSTCPKEASYVRISDNEIYEYRFFIDDDLSPNTPGKYYLYLEDEAIPDFALVHTIQQKSVTDPEADDLIQLKKSPYTDGEYTGICKYRGFIEDDNTHYIQVNLGKKDLLFTEFDPEKGNNSGRNCITPYDSNGNIDGGCLNFFVIDPQLKFSNFYHKDAEGECPNRIEVSRIPLIEEASSGIPLYTFGGIPWLGVVGRLLIEEMFSIGVATSIYNDNTSGKTETYVLYDVRGTNPITGAALSMEKSFDITFSELAPIKNCKDLFGDDMYQYINVIWNLIKIGIPIILIVLGTMDFAKIIFSGKEDEMKKAQEKFIKRLIIAIVIFLVPTLLSYLLEIANSIWGDAVGKDICGIIF